VLTNKLQSEDEISEVVLGSNIDREEIKQERASSAYDDLAYEFAVDSMVLANDIVLNDYQDFIDNPLLSIQENNYIKIMLINTIMYLYNYDKIYDSSFFATDNENTAWIDELSNYYDSWLVISDEIHSLKESYSNNNQLLVCIDANFMRKPQNLVEKENLRISVPINDNTPLRLTYDFELEKTKGVYKIVSFDIGA